jgi:taurine dioxygenase
MTISIHPVSEALGAEIRGVDLAAPIDDATFAAVRAAWLEHLVLLFRDQSLDDAALVAFSRRFGELDAAPIGAVPDGDVSARGFREITVISNVVENGRPIGGLSNYESEWHTDMSYAEVPPMASALYAIEVPPAGGDTGFCNMYRAYETLPADLRARIAGRTAIHDHSLDSAGSLRHGYRPVTDVREAPGAHHPIVRTHPDTGRPALFLGRRKNGYVLGLSVSESEELLDALWAHATRPENAWIHSWRPGDLVIWDNRCLMHRRDGFDAASRRTLHRTQVKGDRPFFRERAAA